MVVFVWSMPMVVPIVFAVIVSVVMADAMDPDVGGILGLAAMGLGGLVAMVWMPLPYLAMTRSNLAGDWGTGFEVGAVFQTFKNAIVESYLGMIVWALVGLLMMLAGMLACIVGIYFAQPVMLAATSMFWVDVYKAAVDRGAPKVEGDMGPIDAYAETFS